MKPISLRRFQHVAGLSDTALVHCLFTGILPLVLREGALYVDAAKIDISLLTHALLTPGEEKPMDEGVVKERLAEVISGHIVDLVREALAILASEQPPP